MTDTQLVAAVVVGAVVLSALLLVTFGPTFTILTVLIMGGAFFTGRSLNGGRR